MSIAAQIFACVAVPSTLVLLVQTILLLLGIGNDSDGAADSPADDVSNVGDDLPGADTDLGEGQVDSPDDFDGFGDLRIFTIRGIIAFLVVFGWVGVLMDSSGAPLFATVPVAAVCGFAMMLALAFLFRAVLRLRSDGNTDNRNAIGTAGKVQLTVPPARRGEGKVHLMLQGAYVERDAVTDEEEPIPTGSEVVVIGVSGQTTLVVKRK